MKGMLSKAFSLALLISVVPSFTMDTKHAAEQVAVASNATPTPMSWYEWVMGKRSAHGSDNLLFNEANARASEEARAAALVPEAPFMTADDVIVGAKYPVYKSPVEYARELSERYSSPAPVQVSTVPVPVQAAVESVATANDGLVMQDWLIKAEDAAKSQSFTSRALDKAKAMGNSIANNQYVVSAIDKAKAASDYVKDTRVAGYVASAANKAAGYARSAVTVPYDYTVGALANKSGLTNVGFVKNDKFYNATIGKFAAQAAITAALAYGTYRAGKAAVNYFRPVQSTHAQVNQALEALYSKLASGEDLVNCKEAKALARLSFMQMAWNNIDKKTVSLKEALKVNPNAKSYIQLINGHLIDLDNDKLISVREKTIKLFFECISTIKGCSKAFHDTLLVVAQPAPKAVVVAAPQAVAVAPQAVVTAPQVPSTWRTKAYNMIKNKYTLGAVAALGAGAAYVYKKGASVVNPLDPDLVGASISML